MFGMFGIMKKIVGSSLPARTKIGLGIGMTAGSFIRSRTAMGAAAGGMWGAISDDTSVVGGAMMGAGGARYLGAGFKRAAMSGAGMGFRGSLGAYGRAFGRGVSGRARMDFRAGKLLGNRGLNKINSSLKGWGRGLGPL